jgi:hypothetical protein
MRALVKYVLHCGLALSITSFLTSCSPCVTYTQMCDLIGGTPDSVATDSGRSVALEDPGTVIVYHGFSCAESDQRGTEDVLKLEDSIDLPRYASNATVFLNGWRTNYLHSDHHLGGVGTMISNIRIENRTLKWQAAGILSDENFDDAYKWCYFYTAVAWNAGRLSLVAEDRDGSCEPRDPIDANFFITENKGTTTALSSFGSFLFNPGFATGKTVAILPRGFGYRWSEECEADHHLLQLAFNLDHGEVFIEKGRKYKKGFLTELTPVPTPQPPPQNTLDQVDTGFASWETYAILKDNDLRRDYGFGQMVSGLGGPDVGVIQPPFSILPHEDAEGIFNACLDESVGIKTDDVAVENVPFQYAIPMLTGWNLGYGCDDHHVTEVGAWIDEFSYDKPPAASTGTLHYKVSSSMKDKDGSPGHFSSKKVSILGFRPTAGSPPEPDLVPFSPAGSDPLAFCRLEQNGTQLRVTVKNQGNADADASKTTVAFRDKAFTLDTPPIPAGGSADLMFRVPAGCFSPECSFTITVDSSDDVDEVANEGNNTVSGGCLG